MKYVLVGYDNDNDIYESIIESDNISYLIKVGTEVAKEESLYRMTYENKKKPFDWFEIVQNDNYNMVYWVS